MPKSVMRFNDEIHNRNSKPIMNRFEPVNSITESAMKVITEEPKSVKKSVGGDL